MLARTQRPIFLIQNASQNRGLITADEASNLNNAFQACQNITFTRYGFGPRRGYSLIGANDNTGTTGIKSLFSYLLSDNSEVLIRSHTTWIEWLNDKGGTDGEWHTLVASLTSGKRFGFAPFNTTTLSTAVNRLFFCNGVENYSEWNGAHTALNGAVTAGATTITVDDTTYFTATGSLLINGTTVTYTGKTATTFTGCASVPTASDNDGVAQLPDTTTYSTQPKMNLMLTAMTRVWGIAGNETVQGNRLYYSKAGTSAAAPDPTNFTAAANLVDPGFRDFPEGGSRINALSNIDDKILVWKENVINTYQFDNTQSTKFDIIGNLIQGSDVGCGALGAVTEAVSRQFFVSKKGGLKILSREEGSQLLRPLQISERILPTIKNFDFDNAIINYDQENNLILVSCASATDLDNDTIICYDIRRDAITLFKGIAASCFVTHKKKIYFGHTLEAKVYKLFDGFTDAGSNVNTSAQTENYTFGDIGMPKAMDYFFIDGWIKSGRKLNIRFDFDNGTQSYKQITLTGDTTLNYIYDVSPNVFGETEFGAYPFGGDPEEFTGMFKFIVAIGFTNLQAHNCSVTFWSSDVGEAWWIGNYGWSPKEGNFLPKNIINIS